jgi:ABC-type amino acid transport substrate-binding protein
VPTYDNDARFTLLNNGSADLSVAGITVTPEREQLVDFIEPYYYGSSFQLFAPNNTVDVSNGWEGLAGKPVCVDQDSIMVDVANRLNMFPVVYAAADEAQTQNAVLANIKSGKCIGLLEEYVRSSIYGLPAVDLPAQGADPNAPTYLAMAVAKGNGELKQKITDANKALFEGGANSEILALENEYMVSNGLKPNAQLAEMVAKVAGPGTPAPPSAATTPSILTSLAFASLILGAAMI